MEIRELNSLKDLPVETLKGIGPARTGALSDLGIRSLFDLLTFFPTKYKTSPPLKSLDRLEEGWCRFEGKVLRVEFNARFRSLRNAWLRTEIGEGKQKVTLVAFQKRALLLKSFLKQGRRVIVEASLKRGERGWESSRFEIYGTEMEEDVLSGSVRPFYSIPSAPFGQKFFRQAIVAALKILDSLPTSSQSRFEKLGLAPPIEAIRKVHIPKTPEDPEEGRRTFAFIKLEEWASRARESRRLRCQRRGTEGKVDRRMLKRWLQGLPYSLTNDQERVLDEIIEDIGRPYPMERLLQGDVGTGKTAVAIAAMMAAVSAGGQAAFVAPTEVLAEQVYWAWKNVIEREGEKSAAILTGGLSPKEKKQTRAAISAGEVELIFGTHALLQKSVDFKKLQLVVIDEEHRFGIQQKLRLTQGEHTPHFLIMTATPIPRSCAMVLYGGMDYSLLCEFPSGRREIETLIVNEKRMEEVYRGLRREIARGRAVYYICPLIEESSKLPDLSHVTGVYEELQSRGFRAGLLHGRLGFEEKRAALQGFRDACLDVLVSTTVVEVGVDVSRAGLIIIENPERFGLAQLHQLRGRVGRDGRKGYCLLLYKSGRDRKAMRRLKAFAAAEDGHSLSLEDLKNRGAGEHIGRSQTGFHWMFPFEPAKDQDLVKLLEQECPGE